MKNFMTNALILTALLTSSQVFAEKASSGNGGGYNGPTLSGDAVEMSLDKPIKAADLTKIIKRCMYDRSTKDGFLKQTLGPLGVGGIILNYSAEVELIEGFTKVKVGDQVRELVAVRPYVTFNQIYANLEVYKTLGAYNPALGTLSYLNSEFQIDSSLRIIADSSQNVKRYDPITQDEVGIDKEFVGLKILRDANEPAFVSLMNKRTNRETQLLAPMADLTNCLVDGLGKM